MYYQPWTSKTTGIVGLFLLASAVYIGGLCPTIYWFDSPEFVTVAHTLDISHPAGSPTYALVTKLATFLPLGSIALRINACSAFIGVVAVVLLFVLLYTLFASESPSTRWIAACGGALFLLVSESFWRFTAVAEVYILQNCFLVLLFLALINARTHSPILQRRYYWTFAFLYGLSAGVHATMALFVPAFLVFIGVTTPRMFRGKELAFLAFFFLIGFSTYLYLPMRSLTEPAFNWGDPKTIEQFLTHISDRKDAAVLLIFYWRQLLHQILMFCTHLSNEFSTLGCILGLLGFLSLFYRDKSLWFLFILAFLGHTIFFIRSWWDTAWGFIPAFVIFTIWIGYGIQTCLRRLENLYQHHIIRLPHSSIYALFLVAMTITLSLAYVRHDPITNQAKNYATELYGKQLLEQLPADAIIFCEYAWFPLLYLQQIERQRPDVTLILQSEIFVPHYYALFSKNRFPNIHKVTSSQATVISTVDYFWLLSRLNEKDHPLFWDPDAQFQREFSENLIPQGLLFAFHPSRKIDVTPDVLHTHRKLLARSMNRILQGTLEDSTTYFLAHKLNLGALYFRRIGLPTEAARMYKTALSMRHEDKGTSNNYGALLLAQREFTKALEQFNVVYAQDPINANLNKNIGAVMLRVGDFTQAAHFFERALAFGAVEGDVYAQLGESYANLGRFSSALHAMQLALQQFSRHIALHLSDDSLQEKIALVQTWTRYIEAQIKDGSHPNSADERESGTRR